MHFTSLALAALVSVAQATNVQVVAVGKSPMNGAVTLEYFPQKIKAEAGTMVQFQFWAGNHTVTQSDFDHPCQPISSVNSSAKGIWSSFMPVAASQSKKEIPVFTVMVNDTKPIWLFCSQGNHCQKGMAMVINEHTGANATRSLENYKNAAAGTSGGSYGGGKGGGYGGGYNNSTGGGGGSDNNGGNGGNGGSGGSQGTGSNGGSGPTPTNTGGSAASTSPVAVSGAANLGVSSSLLVVLGGAFFAFL